MNRAGIITREHTRQSFWSGLFLLQGGVWGNLCIVNNWHLNIHTALYAGFPSFYDVDNKKNLYLITYQYKCTMYNMKVVLCIESIPWVQWVRVNPRTHGPTQDLSQCPWSRILTGESTYSMCACFDDGKIQKKPPQARGRIWTKDLLAARHPSHHERM